MRLTDRALSQMPLLENGQTRIRDDLLPGFGVTVGIRRKTFFVMYGTSRRIKTLGHYPGVSLRDARNAARLVLEVGEQAARPTELPELVDAFLADCRKRLRPKTVASYETVLKNAPSIKVDRADKSLVRTAHEIKAYKAMFNWGLLAVALSLSRCLSHLHSSVITMSQKSSLIKSP